MHSWRFSPPGPFDSPSLFRVPCDASTDDGRPTIYPTAQETLQLRCLKSP